jgi:glycosyltransferase involved in cell wall biosynthesis
MRIGIYNRWLATLGGGERYTLALARVLAADGHAVELITHEPLDAGVLHKRMGVVKQELTLHMVPDSPNNERVSEASGAYDLFFNLSHGDLFAARAPHNILVVYFPLPLDTYSKAGALAVGGRMARVAPSTIDWIDGVYGLEHAQQQSWAWTGRHAHMDITRRWPSPAHVLQVTLADVLPASLPPSQVRVLVNGHCIAQRADGWTHWTSALPEPVLMGKSVAVELNITPWTLRAAGLAPDDKERGLPLRSVQLLRGAVEARVTAQLFDAPWRAIEPTPRSIAAVEKALDSYTATIAISQFTQQWITRRWGRPSQVLYPAVALDVPPMPKRRQILSVGRFFPGSHNKQHLSMIAAFRALCDAGLRGWEYHLVGGYDEHVPAHRTYLEQVRAATAGYPITLHVNASAIEVQQRYGEASIFWHATGYGEDEELAPERFEHFGITTVEAMAVGCVPVVIAKAGQLETVVHGESGLLWHTLDELQIHTRQLVDDLALRERLALGARERSRMFGIDRFAEQVRALVLGVEGLGTAEQRSEN